jgi:histidine ammonia-lyase
MGSNAATKCYKVVENLQRILAIELLNGSQALEFRRPLKSSAIIENLVSDYRKHVPFVEADKIMFTEIEKSVQFLKHTPFVI